MEWLGSYLLGATWQAFPYLAVFLQLPLVVRHAADHDVSDVGRTACTHTMLKVVA